MASDSSQVFASGIVSIGSISQIPEKFFLSASFCLYLSDLFISQVITA